MNTVSQAAVRTPWRRWMLLGFTLIIVAIGLGWWIQLMQGAPFAVDRWWNALTPADPSGPALMFGLVMNRIGGTWVAVYAIPIATAVLLLILRRPWAAAYFVGASALSAGVVQLVKHLVDRARPEGLLVATDAGSYPSGHTANAATIAVILVVLAPRVWVALVGAAWLVLMGLSRTIVHAHWVSDTVGGALIGAGVALAVGAALTVPLARERDASRARRG